MAAKRAQRAPRKRRIDERMKPLVDIATKLLASEPGTRGQKLAAARMLTETKRLLREVGAREAKGAACVCPMPNCRIPLATWSAAREHFANKHNAKVKTGTTHFRQRVGGGHHVRVIECFGCDREFELRTLPPPAGSTVAQLDWRGFEAHLRIVHAAGKLQGHVVLGSARGNFGGGSGNVSNVSNASTAKGVVR